MFCVSLGSCPPGVFCPFFFAGSLVAVKFNRPDVLKLFGFFLFGNEQILSSLPSSGQCYRSSWRSNKDILFACCKFPLALKIVPTICDLYPVFVVLWICARQDVSHCGFLLWFTGRLTPPAERGFVRDEAEESAARTIRTATSQTSISRGGNLWFT